MDRLCDHFTNVRTGDITRNVSAMLADVTSLARSAWRAHPACRWRDLTLEYGLYRTSVTHLRKASRAIPDDLLKHIALRRERINLPAHLHMGCRTSMPERTGRSDFRRGNFE
jgi:hypothetical protein